MGGINEKTDQRIEIEVCLVNRDEEKAKTAGTLTADSVHMLRMTVKVDTGCTELALNNDLVQKLNVSIGRYGPVPI